MPPSSPTPTSFIPKKPLDAPTAYRESGGLGFLFFASLLIFIASAVAAGGVYGYTTFLSTSIADKQASLQKAESEFDPEQINQLVLLDSRINSAKTLLVSHIAPSSIFAFLGQQTLPNVQFTTFVFGLNPDGSGSIVLSGSADGFATVALQSDQFNAASKILKNVVFSNVNTSNNSESGGKVTFSIAADVDPSFLSYARTLGSNTVSPQPQATVPATSTSPTPSQ
jgi:hypothetical protein